MPLPGIGPGYSLRASRALFALTALTLVAAMLFGGGQGSLAESLTSVPGLLLILFAAFVASAPGVSAETSRVFWLVPAGLLVLPLVQLVPLPPAIWTRLPGREVLAEGLIAAGVSVGWGRWSLAPAATEGVLWSAVVPAGIFMSAALLSGRQRRVLVLVTLAFAGLSALIGLWQLMEGPTSQLYLYRVTNLGEAVGLFANRNHLASLLAVALPVAAGTLADRARRKVHGVRDLQVWLLTALIVLLSVAVTATRSRAGFALFMLSVLASAVVLFDRRDSGSWSGAKPWLRVGAVLAGVMIVQLTLYGMLSRLDRDPLEEHRWALTANTLQAARPALGMGYGLGTFVPAYDEIGDASADIPPYVNHAHNDYAELWLEGGVVAIVLVASALIVLGLQCARLWRERHLPADEEGDDLGLRVGASLGLVLIALHSSVDYPLRTLTMASIAALLAAVMLGRSRMATDSRWQTPGKPSRVGAVFNG